MDEKFWEALERLVAESEIVIDRPKGTRHKKYSEAVYEIDYGFLKNTASMDGGGIDVWLGSDNNRGIDGIVCTVDLYKRDSEVKILIGCTDEEKKWIYNFHNVHESMKGIMINRE